MSLSDGVGDAVFGKSLHPGQLASQGLTSVCRSQDALPIPVPAVCVERGVVM